MGISMTLEKELSAATSIDALFAILDKYTTPIAKAVHDAVSPEPQITFGATKAYRENIAKTRLEANRKAMAIIDRVGGDASQLTDDDRQALAEYSGNGGIGDSVSEYYTPQWLAQGVWDQVKAYGFNGGSVLEPSAGTGVFLSTKPKGTIVTATEISPISSAVNQLLHPSDYVENTPFERLADSTPDGEFDAVVGNVPFGGNRTTRDLDPAYEHIKSLDEYFVERSIDKCKAGGLITLICPTRTVDGKKMQALRRRISLKAEFLGAHRIPAGTFSNSGSSSVVTDVVVFRKFPADVAAKMCDLDNDVLTESKVLWDTFIKGEWFKKDGKRFVHGETAMVTNMVGKSVESIVIPNLTKGGSKAETMARNAETAAFNAGIKSKLATPFESRIDWAMLNAAEPLQSTPTEGDTKFIYGRQHTFTDGEWVQTLISNKKGGAFDAAEFGASSIDEIRTNVNTPENLLAMSYNEIINVYNQMRDVMCDSTRDSVKLALDNADLDDADKERVIRGAAIGRMIQSYQDAVGVAPDQAQIFLPKLQMLVSNEFERYGATCNARQFKALSGKMSREFHLFAQSTDGSGTFSALLQGEIDRSKLSQFDPMNAESVVSHIYTATNNDPISLDVFRRYSEDPYIKELDNEKLLSYLAQHDGIAVTKFGNVMPMARSTSGSVSSNLRDLKNALISTSDPVLKANYDRQIDLINKKRDWTASESITFNMNAKWIPRRYVLEFLRAQGYSELAYESLQTDEEGNEVWLSADDNFGKFVGYTEYDGEKLKSTKENAFARQLENHLNGQSVRGGGAAGVGFYRDQIQDLESKFADFIRFHADHEMLVDKFNSTFNDFIEFQHSQDDLGIEGLSGKVTLMGYQNEAIRRLSEDGKGILGFGTGLGKTLTALGLVEYNSQTGRSRRTAIVTPKSVYENWFNETVKLKGVDKLHEVSFPSIEPILDKNGGYVFDPVLDEKGEPVINKNTGEPETTIRVKWLSGADLVSKINKIAHSKFKTVVFTKEVFASIPLKPETIDEEVSRKIAGGYMSGKISDQKSSYRNAAAMNSIESKARSTGTAKSTNFPFFEDLAIDNVIVDEGHMFRNSIKAGMKAARLAYLSTSNEAAIAVDLRQKSAYLNHKYNRGTVLLTATPNVNSPLDCYNMLSHIMTDEQWADLGIFGQDDFIDMFAQTENITLQKLSGAMYDADAVTGFKNLDALRKIFNRYTNIQDAESVQSDVTIPDLVEISNAVEINQEQKDIYEELRFRAEISYINKMDETEKYHALSAMTPDDQIRAADIMERYPDDQTFSIIRDMDRVTNDLDLYHKQVTFVLPKGDKETVIKLLADMPNSLEFKEEYFDKEQGKKVTEKWSVQLNPKITEEGNAVKVVVAQEFEDEFASRFGKFGIDESKVSHPTPPKTAAMLEIIKNDLAAGGKVLVFSEEKITHRRLHRTICEYCGLNKNQVGILNGDTVAGKSSVTNDKLEKGKRSDEAKGIEAIAEKYNSGQFLVLICNKKAEVGVNLHKGTTSIIHLTLPWTPSAMEQRNGRGARVGSSQSEVKVHTFAAAGTFDDRRMDTIKRKRGWINNIMHGEQSTAKNEDIDSISDVAALVSNDPEAFARRLEMMKAKEMEKRKAAKRKTALSNAAAYVKAAQALERAKTSESNSDKLKTLQTLQERLERYENELKTYEPSSSFYRNKSDDIARLKQKIEREQKRAANPAPAKADPNEDVVKRLKPALEKAINEGLLVGSEHEILSNPQNMLSHKGVLYCVDDFVLIAGKAKVDRNEVYRITEIMDVDAGKMKAAAVSGYSRDQAISVKDVIGKASYTADDQEILRNADGFRIKEAHKRLDCGEAKFRQMIRDGLLYCYDNTIMVFKKDGKGFDFIRNNKRPNPNYVDLFIYPDPSNKRLKSQFIAAAKTLPQKMGYDNESAYEGYAEALFGKKWAENIAAGNLDSEIADQSTIEAFIKGYLENIDTEQFIKTLKESIGDDDLSDVRQYTVKDLLISQLRAAIPSKYINYDDFTRDIYDVAENYAEIMMKSINDAVGVESNQVGNELRMYANQPVSMFIARLTALREAVQSLDNPNAINPNKVLNHPECDFYKEDLVILIADLDRAGLLPSSMTQSGDNVSRKTIRRWVYMRRAMRNATVEALSKIIDNPPAETDAQEIALDEAEINQAVFDECDELRRLLAPEGSANRLTINEGELTLPVDGKMMRFEPMSLYCYQPQIAANKSLDEIGGIVAMDVSDAFSGEWIFVPVSTPTQKIVEVLSGEAAGSKFTAYQAVLAGQFGEYAKQFFDAALDGSFAKNAYAIAVDIIQDREFAEIVDDAKSDNNPLKLKDLGRVIDRVLGNMFADYSPDNIHAASKAGLQMAALTAFYVANM